MGRDTPWTGRVIGANFASPKRNSAAPSHMPPMTTMLVSMYVISVEMMNPAEWGQARRGSGSRWKQVEGGATAAKTCHRYPGGRVVPCRRNDGRAQMGGPTSTH